MKLEKKALGISLYLFIASFFSERLWFNSDHLNLHNSIYIITKVMLLFTLIILGQVLYKGIIMVLQKDENAIFFAKIFFVYFILLIAVLLLIWPGISVKDAIFLSFIIHLYILTTKYATIPETQSNCIIIIPAGKGKILKQQM